MSDELRVVRAKEAYDILCKALDEREWHYQKFEDDLVVSFNVNGEDIPMSFVIKIDTSRQLIRLFSYMPFSMPEDKRMEGALACCVASYGLVNGSFIYRMKDGSISFCMTNSYADCAFGTGLVQYMISCACSTVERYNDRFLAIAKGLMDIDDFMKADQA